MQFKVERYKTLEQFQQALNTLQPDWLKDSWVFDSQSGSIIAVYVKQDIKEPAVAKVIPINRITDDEHAPDWSEEATLNADAEADREEGRPHDWNNVAAFTPKPQEEAA